MAAESRNTKIVVCLILSMTVGAAVLLWLEPRTDGWSDTALLMAERRGSANTVLIEYVPEHALQPAQYDCIVRPDGRCEWQPDGPDIRIALVGADEQGLELAQARTLLAVLGSLNKTHGLKLDQVWLHPDSDPREVGELPIRAHDLYQLLARKRMIQ